MDTNRHHLFFTREDYRKHTMPCLVREHPVNIQPMEIWRHNQLHAEVGRLAVMSEPLARETLEFLGDLPNEVQRLDTRFVYLPREISNFERLSHRNGALGREASYFARVLEMQLPFIRPME